MSFVQFLRILWARRTVIAGATALCLLAGVLAIKLIPPRYEAASRVMLDVVKPDPVTGQVIATAFARAYTRTQTELIRDYRVTGSVVDQLGWLESPDMIRQYEARPADDRRDMRRWAAQRIADGTSAKLLEGSNILEITYSSTSPETARKVADAVRTAYIEQSLAFRRDGARKTADWFDGQVTKVRDDLAKADARKTAFERANRIVLNDDQSDTESSRLKALSSVTPLPQQAVAAAAAGPSPAAAQLAQVDAQIATVAQTLGPNHPTLIQLRQQRSALASTAARERAAAAPAAVASGPSIASQVSAQTQRVIAQREKLEELRRLSADVAVLRDQYAKTAARATELRQEAESNETGVTLLGSAVAPQEPVFPKVPLIVFGALAGGFALGLAIALVTELFSRRVRGIEDLTGTASPVIIVLSGTRAEARPSLAQRLRLGHARTA